VSPASRARPPSPSLVGTTLASYTIRSEVGEGGTSAVYQAHHPQHGTVALKILREKLRNDPTAVTRFLREAQYGSRVQHRNVVRTLEIGQAETGKHFIALEWAQGVLLERYARRNAPLPTEEVATIVEQIAAAVQAAHEVKIVHRDLKPDNVMYDSSSEQVKLLDFGIAADTQLTADDRLTRAGFFVGTLLYVAPEALSGELVGPAADQYSLATITYFLLTGALPYTARTPREMFTQLLTIPPKSLNSARDGLHFHPAVEAVVMRGLSRQPSGRFATVVEFSERLKEALRLAPEKTGLLSKVKGILGR
jgi:eukaryotic-like serine/threonine-protein kinase